MKLFIEAPTHLRIGNSSKRRALTLNEYRNWHYRVSNSLKKEYKLRVVRAQLPQDVFTLGQAKITCTFFSKTKWRSDLDNFCAVHTKFCLDALVEYWYLEDDNIKYIKEIIYRYWWVDKENPRVDILVEEVF